MADPAELLQAAAALRQAGDLGGAVALCRELAELRPSKPRILKELAMELGQLGEWRAAADAARRMVDQVPANERAWVLLAACLEHAGAILDAALAYREAVRLDPGNERAAIRANRLLGQSRRPEAGSGRRICLYSAVFGEYDPIWEPVRQVVDCDYLLVTDRPEVVPKGSLWKVVALDTFGFVPMHPRLAARYMKIMGHELFRFLSRLHYDAGLHSYDHVVWVDGSVRITSPDFVSFMIGSIGPQGIAMIKHPERDCIYDEAVKCTRMTKCKGMPVLEQTEHYRAQGYPAHNGLMATTVFARDMRRPDLDAVIADWWEENLKWTCRDQLSLPYVLWKHGRWYDEIDASLLANPYFQWQVFKRKRTSTIT